MWLRSRSIGQTPYQSDVSPYRWSPRAVPQERSATVHRSAHLPTSGRRASRTHRPGVAETRTGGFNAGPSDGINTHRTQRPTDGCPVEAPSSRPCLTRTPHLQAPEVAAAAATLRKCIFRSFCTVEGYHQLQQLYRRCTTRYFSLKFLTFAVGFGVFGRGFGVKSVDVATLHFLISNCPEMGVCLKLQVWDDLEWVRNKVWSWMELDDLPLVHVLDMVITPVSWGTILNLRWCAHLLGNPH